MPDGRPDARRKHRPDEPLGITGVTRVHREGHAARSVTVGPEAAVAHQDPHEIGVQRERGGVFILDRINERHGPLGGARCVHQATLTAPGPVLTVTLDECTKRQDSMRPALAVIRALHVPQVIVGALDRLAVGEGDPVDILLALRENTRNTIRLAIRTDHFGAEADCAHSGPAGRRENAGIYGLWSRILEEARLVLSRKGIRLDLADARRHPTHAQELELGIGHAGEMGNFLRHEDPTPP